MQDQRGALVVDVHPSVGRFGGHLQRIIRRVIRERSWLHVASVQDSRLTVTIDQTLPKHAYTIDMRAGHIRITGADRLGLLTGIGRWLRVHHANPSVDGRLTEYTVPVLPVRGMYWATHFGNAYVSLPVAWLQRYIEDLALWGVNQLAVWFDLHHYAGMQDPASQAMLKRLLALLQCARQLGMDTALTTIANEGFVDTPDALKADWRAGQNGYHAEPAGHYHVEVCPSSREGLELILRNHAERLDAFAPIGPDCLWIWPYDQGGCTCADCAPWGANGFLRVAERVATLYKQRNPEGKVLLSTWYFDHFTDGEWAGLAEAFRSEKLDWVDLLMADDNGYTALFPEYPLTHGVPGGLPMVGFPEISMYRQAVWGGWGANPYPARLQSLWDLAGHALQGGYPYSEGIYEDLNKIIMAQLYMDPTTTTDQAMRHYLSWYVDPRFADVASEACRLMEISLPRTLQPSDGRNRYILERPDAAVEAWDRIHNVQDSLTQTVRNRWRWRLIYLRALIDNELACHDGELTGRALSALSALQSLYRADGAETWLQPMALAQ